MSSTSSPEERVEIEVSCLYYLSASANLALREGKTWEDVEDYYVRWDRTYIKYEGDEQVYVYSTQFEPNLDSIDWKEPVSVSINDPETGDLLNE